MYRTLLAVAAFSLFTLAGCEWPTYSGTGSSGFDCGSACVPSGPQDQSGYTSVWVETETTGDTAGVDEHRLTVTYRGFFEHSERLPLSGREHFFRYTEENAVHFDDGLRTATFSPGAERCRVTSENPQQFTVSRAEPSELTLRFSVAC